MGRRRASRFSHRHPEVGNGGVRICQTLDFSKGSSRARGYTLSHFSGIRVAQTALAMALAKPLQRLMDAYPHRPLGGILCVRPCGSRDHEDGKHCAFIRWCLYVDDVAVHVMGGRAAVAETISRTTSAVIESLKVGLKMEVSRREQCASDGKGKTVVAVNDARVKAAVATFVIRLGIKVQGNASHLGVHFQLGARTRAAALDKPRWAATVKKRIRARRLRARLGNRFFRTGALPASNYGPATSHPSKGTV